MGGGEEKRITEDKTRTGKRIANTVSVQYILFGQTKRVKNRHMKKYFRNTKWIVFAFGLSIYLLGCAHQPRPDSFDPPGFFMGFFHGFTILFSFIASMFSDIRIYSFPNSGFWYDCGYLIGASIFLGGSTASGTSK